MGLSLLYYYIYHLCLSRYDSNVVKPQVISYYFKSENQIDIQNKINYIRSLSKSNQLITSTLLRFKSSSYVPSLATYHGLDDILTTTNNAINTNTTTATTTTTADTTVFTTSTLCDDSYNSTSTAYSKLSIPGRKVLANVYIIDDYNSLSQLALLLSTCSEFGFDCEMHTFRTYYPITCILQISTLYTNYLIDTICLWEYIGPVLSPLFSDPSIVKVGHAISTMDIPCLFRDFGIVIINGFDTQIAADTLGISKNGLVGVLDYYKCCIVEDMSNSKMSMKSTDWRVRPLTAEMIKYTALDVHYLLPLYYIMCDALLHLSPDEKSVKELLKFNKAATTATTTNTSLKPTSTKAIGGSVEGSPAEGSNIERENTLVINTDSNINLIEDDDEECDIGGGTGDRDRAEEEEVEQWDRVLTEDDIGGKDGDDDDALWEGWGESEAAVTLAVMNDSATIAVPSSSALSAPIPSSTPVSIIDSSTNQPDTMAAISTPLFDNDYPPPHDLTSSTNDTIVEPTDAITTTETKPENAPIKPFSPKPKNKGTTLTLTRTLGSALA